MEIEDDVCVPVSSINGCWGTCHKQRRVLRYANSVPPEFNTYGDLTKPNHA